MLYKKIMLKINFLTIRDLDDYSIKRLVSYKFWEIILNYIYIYFIIIRFIETQDSIKLFQTENIFYIHRRKHK